MKQKIGEFEFEYKIDKMDSSINQWMKDQIKLHEKEKLKRERELRLKKLNKLNKC